MSGQEMLSKELDVQELFEDTEGNPCSGSAR